MTSAPSEALAQQTWNNLSANKNWSNSTSTWNANDWWANPGGDLYFGTSGSGNVTNNMTDWTDFGGIFFNSGAASFTISGNSIGLTNTAKIENNSANTQTVNLNNIALRKAAEFNPVAGNLTIGSANIFLDGFQLNVFGNAGHTLEFSSGTIISGTGAGSTFSINQNSTVIFQSAHTYAGDTFVNAGTLRFTGSGKAGNSDIRLGDTTGSAAAKIQIASGVTLDTTNSKTLVVRPGSSGTKTIESTATTGTATLSRNTFLDADLTTLSASGGTFAISSSTFDLKNQTLTVTGAGNTTISSVLSQSTGAGKLVKSDSGVLTLSGSSANTLSGGITVNGGTLVLGKTAGVNAIGSGNMTINAGGTVRTDAANQTGVQLVTVDGIFNLNNNSQQFSLAGTGTLQLGSGTFTNTNTINDTFSGKIEGSGNIVKTGVGIFNLTSTTSDFTGSVTINGGLLTINNDRALGAVPGSPTAGKIVIGNAQLGVSATTIIHANRGITLTSANSTIDAFGGATVTYNGIIAGSGTHGLNKAGPGTLVLGGNNTYTGLTTVSNGVVRATHANAFGTSAGGVSVVSGAAVELSGDITIANEALTLRGDGLSSAGALRSVGGSNNYDGLITLNGGDTYIGAANGATLKVGAISGGANALWVVGDGTTILSSGATNSGNSSSTAFVKTNTGTAILMSSNAWAGNEFIREGTVIISNNNALGVGGTTTIGAESGTATATLTLGSGVINSNAINVVGGGTGIRTLDYQTAAGTGEQKGNIALNNSLAFNVLTGGTMLFSGTVTPSGTVRLALDGGGTLISTGNSTGATSTSYQVRIGSGTLIIGAGTIVARTNTLGLGHALDLGVDLNNAAVNAVSALRASNNITISNSIFVSTTNSQARIIGASGANAAATFSGPIGLADAAIWLDSTNGQTVLVSGPITNFSGTGSLIKTNDGLAILTGANTYSGTTTISGGTLQVGNGGSTGQLGSGNVTNNGALVFNRTGILTTANLISGSGSLTKLGAGTLTLSGANTYSGGTILSAGGIRIGNNAAFGTGSVTLDAGTLASSSTAARAIANSIIIGGNITLGEATSGTGSGALTFSGPVSLGSDTKTITVNNVSNRITGIISGAGGLTKAGDGILLISGANTYSGNTTVSAGTLLLGANNVIDNASAVVINGGTLSVVNRTNTVASLTMSSGALTLSTGRLTLANASSLTGGGVTYTAAGRMFTTGTTTLGNTDINYNSGTAQNNAFVLGGGLSVNNSATARFTNQGGGAVRLNLSNAVRDFAIGSAGHLDIDWVVWSSTASSGGITKTGAGTLTLGQANLFTGGFTISEGIVRAGTDTSLGSGGIVTLNGGSIASTTDAARTFANQLTIGGNVTFGQAGTGALTFSSTLTNNLGGGSRTLTTLVDTKIDGAIGNGSIVKEEGSALILSNASNNFSGLTINNGTVRFQTNAAVNSLAGSSGTLDLVGGTLSVSDTTGTGTLASTISGAGNLTKAGNSTLVLSGNNTGYGGTTTLTAGTLRAGSDTALGTGTLALNGGIFASGSSAARGLNNAVTIGGNVQLGDATGTGNLTLSNTVDLGGSTRTLTVLNETLMSGAVSNGGITKEGAGTLQLSNAATSFGALTVNAGQLAIRTNAAVTQLAGTGGTLDLAGASTLTVTSTSANNSIASAISGSGNLVKAGDGTLVLAGNNTYSGTTTISNGLVRMNSSGTAIGGNVVIAGGRLNYQSTVNNQIATNATLTMSSGEFVMAARTNAVASMSMSGGSLSLSSGTLTLGGASSFTGGTVTISAGGGRIDTAGETTFGAVTFSNTASVVVTNALVLGGNVVTTGSGTTVFGSTGGTPYMALGGDTRTFNIASGTAMEVGWGVRGGGITQTGDGRLDLLASAGGSLTAVTLSSGTMRVGVDDALGAASLLALNGGAFASASSDARTVTNNLNIGGNVTLGQSSGGTGALTFSNANLGGQARTLTVDQAVNFVGAVTNGSLTKAGNATLAISNVATSLANLNITAGSVAFQTNATVGGLAGSGGGALSLAGGTLTVAASTNSSFGQVISGAGGLAKTGAGTLTLSGENTYSGATTVSGGRLAVTGTNTSSAILVTNTGTLSGTGVVGNVVVADGGIIAPGSSPGNLTVGDFTMAGGGGYQWEITDVSGAAGVQWDLITITGNTSITATSGNRFTIFITGSSVDGWDPDANDSWIIMDWSGGTGPGAFDPDVFTLNTADFGDTISGLFSLTADSNYLTLVYTGATGTPTYSGGDGLWSTGFIPGIVNSADAIFDGGPGTATNNIASATFDTVGTITFATNATGSYTLEAASGSAGFDTNSALIVAGNIVNNSAYAQTVDMALSIGSTKIANAASNDIILSGDIIGSGGIDKIGDNLLVLSGDNSYTGATVISNGTIRLGSATALGSTAAGTTVASGATLDLNGQTVTGEALSLAGTGVGGNGALINSSASASSLSGAVTLTGNSTVGTTGDMSLSGGVSGAFSLTKIGAATLTLSGSNNYSGGTIITAGSLLAGNNNAFGTGAITINGGGLGSTGANRTLANNLVAGGNFFLGGGGNTTTFNGTLDLGGAERTINFLNTATFNGVISNGSLAVSTASGLTQNINIAASNTYTGATTIASGSFNLNNAGALSSSSAVNITASAGNARFNISGITADSTTIGSLASASSTGATVNLGSKTLVAGGDNSNTTFGGVMSNTGSFVKTGTGTMTFTRASTYTGTTTISNGEIALSESGALSASTALNLAGATSRFDISGISGAGSTNRTVGSLAGASGSVVNLGGKILTVGGNDASTTFAGGISGTGGSLTKSGNGTLTLSGANTFSGGSTLSAGVLRAASSSALGTGALVASGGTTLEITNGVTIANNMSVYSIKFLDDGNTLTGTITNNNATYDVASGTTNTVSGFITGDGGLTLIGGGQLNVTGTTNDYAGATVISNGTLQISTLANAGTVSSIGTNGTIELDGATTSAAVIDYTGGSVSTDRTFALGGGTNGGGTLRIDDAATVVTATGSVTGEGTFVVDGPGTLVLSNTTANQFNPDSIQVNSGATLALGASEQLGNGTGLILNGGTFLVGGDTFRYSETLGTLTLSASSTIDFGAWSGGTNTLSFNDSSAITWTGTLTITNWQGVAMTTNDVTQILFGTGGLTSTQLSQIYFANQDIDGGALIGGELVPVPEPRVYAAAVALMAVVGWRERKRLRDLLGKVKFRRS